jgi:hypothetical protein
VAVPPTASLVQRSKLPANSLPEWCTLLAAIAGLIEEDAAMLEVAQVWIGKW